MLTLTAHKSLFSGSPQNEILSPGTFVPTVTKFYNIGWYIRSLKPLFDQLLNFWLSFHSSTQPTAPIITAAVSASTFVATLEDYEENAETKMDRERRV
jgi:hypothetical protein